MLYHLGHSMGGCLANKVPMFLNLFVLNSTEHEILKMLIIIKIPKIKEFFCFLNIVFIMLIIVKMPKLKSGINFMLI